MLDIPIQMNLSAHPDGFHYQAFIGSINEKSSSYLRKYVNKLINNKPTEWIKLDLENSIEINHKNTIDQDESDDEILTKKNNEMNSDIDHKQNSVDKRQKSKRLKSKL